MSNDTIRLMMGPLLPTAASAWWLENRPTTATSVELKSCCKMLLAASGMAKTRIFFKSGPCSMSIVLDCAMCLCESMQDCKITAFFCM